jgi:hypothetical protein
MPGRLDKSDPRANYRYAADPKYSCQHCLYFIAADPADLWEGGACRKVVGDIRAVDTCNQWTAIRGKRAEAIGDSKFPEPVDAWQTAEDDGAAWPRAAHQHAAAAVEALADAGWAPITNEALHWRHTKLPKHEIEVSRSGWFHTYAGNVRACGHHHELAGYVRASTKLHRLSETMRGFERLYED